MSETSRSTRYSSDVRKHADLVQTPLNVTFSWLPTVFFLWKWKPWRKSDHLRAAFSRSLFPRQKVRSFDVFVPLLHVNLCRRQNISSKSFRCDRAGKAQPLWNVVRRTSEESQGHCVWGKSLSTGVIAVPLSRRPVAWQHRNLEPGSTWVVLDQRWTFG